MDEITIGIDTTGEAFEPDPGVVVARLLRELADAIEDGRAERLSRWPLSLAGDIVGTVTVD